MASDPIKQFKIEPIIEFVPGGVVDLSFTNSSLWMLIAVILSTTYLTLSTKQKALVPNRFQAFSELFYEFVAGMIRDNIGSKGREYFPVVFTTFVIVLLGNVLGLIPHSFTYTSHIIVTVVLAVMIFTLVTVMGFIKNGFGFLSLFCPPGIPFALKFVIVPLELFSFLLRPITLSVRLFANMLAGHLILKVFAGFSVSMLALGSAGIALGIVPMLFNVALYCLELLIALLQAYIFAVLSCVYLKDTVDLHH